MANNKQNSWFNWLKPENTGNISPQSPTLMYIGGKASRTGEVITPENALKNPTVFACVTFLAQTIAQLPWGISKTTEVGFNPISNHELQKLLARPNAGMSEYEFKFSIVVDLLTYGNCYLLKVVTASGKVIELIPLRADEMKPQFSASGKRSYRHDNGTVYPADRIIHIRDFIGSSIDGLSKVAQCHNLVAIDNAIDNTLADHFRNGTAISGVVSFAGDVPVEIKKAFGDAWAEKFGGRGSSRGSIAVLDGGATFDQVESQSPADADMLNLKQQTMTRIAAIFRVPAYAIEIADGSKYDNLSQRQSGFYRDSIAPLTKNIQQKITEGLLTDPELEIEFDSSEILKGDMQSATTVAVQAVRSGLLTIDEGRDLMGYPELKETPKPKEPENEPATD